MKKTELLAINFKESLPICYDDIEPFLLKELNDLRQKLINLSDESDESTKLELFKEAVENLNALEENELIESGIDTEEREGLCDALYKMGTIVGLDESTDYIDNWRNCSVYMIRHRSECICKELKYGWKNMLSKAV